LGIIGGQKAVGLLVKALTDNDLRIRSMAALNLGKVGKTAGLIPLWRLSNPRNFSEKKQAKSKPF